MKMRNTIVVLCLCILSVTLVSCGQREQKKLSMNNMRMIGHEKSLFEFASEEGTITLEAIGTKVNLDVSNYEITEAWNDREASEDTVILKDKRDYGGKTLVLYANGNVEEQ